MNFWKDKCVFVTGATGLVGSWLVKDLIKKGAKVSALILDYDMNSELIRSGDIKFINTVDGNLRDYATVFKAIQKHNSQVIFHLGAQTIVGTAINSPKETFESNIQGTWNILETTRKLPNLVESVVVASSDKAYGSSKNLPYVEDHPLKGVGPYDVSKSCTDLIAQAYGLTYGLPVTISRCGNIYGGGDLNWSRIIPGTIRSLLNAQQPVLRSNGLYIRDYINVDDVVSAYLLLAEETTSKNLNGQAFNFSTDIALTVLELYEAICMEAVGRKVEPKILNEATSEIKDQHLDSKKAKHILNWNSKIDLHQGLQSTVKWYKEFLLGAA